ncbi:unnamed protein product [Vitrella brassicaformis CCMP3155]|uniref:Uncharacterized protein n=1 Tax=Vitrella brassicaformis (strain CCMP3155) TaxID=1169540 RepID=A0A0G4GJ56_VITBC|nr:unnamed protein product [Vitrella brassicaformis CCMP3155]|eukprot:CEM29879.1 unnamed protein product [Vitrella brassicaformis CCMP3155]
MAVQSGEEILVGPTPKAPAPSCCDITWTLGSFLGLSVAKDIALHLSSDIKKGQAPKKNPFSPPTVTLTTCGIDAGRLLEVLLDVKSAKKGKKVSQAKEEQQLRQELIRERSNLSRLWPPERQDTKALCSVLATLLAEPGGGKFMYVGTSPFSFGSSLEFQSLLPEDDINPSWSHRSTVDGQSPMFPKFAKTAVFPARFKNAFVAAIGSGVYRGEPRWTRMQQASEAMEEQPNRDERINSTDTFGSDFQEWFIEEAKKTPPPFKAAPASFCCATIWHPKVFLELDFEQDLKINEMDALFAPQKHSPNVTIVTCFNESPEKGETWNTLDFCYTIKEAVLQKEPQMIFHAYHFGASVMLREISPLAEPNPTFSFDVIHVKGGSKEIWKSFSRAMMQASFPSFPTTCAKQITLPLSKSRSSMP